MLRVLSAATQPMSILEISEAVNFDVFDVMEVIEQWLEFLREFRDNQQVQYQLYHDSFRVWLSNRL